MRDMLSSAHRVVLPACGVCTLDNLLPRCSFQVFNVSAFHIHAPGIWLPLGAQLAAWYTSVNRTASQSLRQSQVPTTQLSDLSEFNQKRLSLK